MRMRISLFVLTALLWAAPRISMMSGELPVIRLDEFVEVRAFAPRTCTVLVTAYNSEVAQTDDTPFVTASQTPTRRGVIATRWLPIGARVRILHDEFAGEVFRSEDRMPVGNWCKLDVWHAQTDDAKDWGKRFVQVEVLDVPAGFNCPDRPLTTGHRCPVPVSEWNKQAAKPICPSWKEGCPRRPV